MESLNNEENFLTFSGPFNMRIISGIGKFLADNLNAPEEIKTRAYKVFIELAQNVSLYSAKRFVNDNGSTTGEGFVKISVNDSIVKLTTRNKVLKEHGSILIKNCQNINHAKEEELKDKKHVLRRESTFSDSGAHIGLITISLLSRNPLEIDISENANAHYFTISSVINKT